MESKIAKENYRKVTTELEIKINEYKKITEEINNTKEKYRHVHKKLETSKTHTVLETNPATQDENKVSECLTRSFLLITLL